MGIVVVFQKQLSFYLDVYAASFSFQCCMYLSSFFKVAVLVKYSSGGPRQGSRKSRWFKLVMTHETGYTNVMMTIVDIELMQYFIQDYIFVS